MLMRWIALSGMAAALLAAFVIYPIKYDSHELQEDIRFLEREIEQERVTIDVLRAEWSYLTRPQRLQELAREHLALQPVGIEASGFHVADLPWREVRERREVFFMEERQ